MKSKVLPALLALSAAAATLAYGGLPGQEGRKTVAQGVYTATQADRGMQVIEDFGCRNCHGGQFEGGLDEQPPLVGEQFITAWTGRKLDELAEKITTMPADQPDEYHVRPAGAADVIAYLLRSNGFPEGKSEVPADASSLKLIEIVAPESRSVAK